MADADGLSLFCALPFCFFVLRHASSQSVCFRQGPLISIATHPFAREPDRLAMVGVTVLLSHAALGGGDQHARQRGTQADSVVGTQKRRVARNLHSFSGFCDEHKRSNGNANAKRKGEWNKRSAPQKIGQPANQAKRREA
jgi:hypothetical protein